MSSKLALYTHRNFFHWWQYLRCCKNKFRTWTRDSHTSSLGGKRAYLRLKEMVEAFTRGQDHVFVRFFLPIRRLAGGIATTVTFPLEVVKTRLQVCASMCWRARKKVANFVLLPSVYCWPRGFKTRVPAKRACCEHAGPGSWPSASSSTAPAAVPVYQVSLVL